MTAGRAVRTAAVLAERLGVPLVVATSWTRQRPEDLGPAFVRSLEGHGTEIASSIGYQAARQTGGRRRRPRPRGGAGRGGRDRDPRGRARGRAARPRRVPRGALVVIGSKGLTASPVLQLGSVPNKVLHHPVGDVLVVRTEEERSRSRPGRCWSARTGRRPRRWRCGAASRSRRRSACRSRSCRWAAARSRSGRWRPRRAGRGGRRAGTTEQEPGDPASVLVQRGGRTTSSWSATAG